MGISIWQLLIILAIVLVLFGAKRLRNIGTDLGSAVKGFKQSMNEEEKKPAEEEQATPEQIEETAEARVIEGEARRENEKV